MAVAFETSRGIAFMAVGIALVLGARWCTRDEPALTREKTKHGAPREMVPQQDSDAESVVRCTPVPVENPRIDDGCFVDERYAWAYRSGNPVRTTDGGRSWEEMKPLDQTEAASAWTTDIYLRPFFITPTRGWLTGDRYTWQTDDAGLTWRRIIAHPADPPDFADATHGWMNVSITDVSARSYVTDDGGETWSPCGRFREYDTSQTPSGRAHFATEKLGWVITSQTVDRQTIEGVARTTDGGCSWSQLWTSYEHPDETYFDIYFINSREGWLTGIVTGQLLHTTDGGKTWRDSPLPEKVMKLSYVYFSNSAEGWFVNVFGPPSESGIYHTTNGGNTWTHLPREVISTGLGISGANPIPAKWKAGRFVQMLYGK